MNVVQIDDAALALERVQEVLEREEAVNNLSLGLLMQYARDPDYGRDREPPFFALVEHEGDVPLVMVMTPPHNMILYGQGDHLDGAIEAALSFLEREETPVPGVIGPRDIAQRFAAAWQERTECVVSVLMEQMIYRLDRVAELDRAPGRLILAAEEHIPLLAEWLVGFSEATLDLMEPDEAREKAEQAIAVRRVTLWVDGEPVSMSWRARPTRHGIVVTGVYTPPALRGRGYASSCVAALSQRLLDEGYGFCALYTDLSNPTSNHIYRRIGYRPVRPSVVLGFAGPA